MANITSDALTTAVTSAPSCRPSSRTASTVIEATSRSPLASSSTLAIASPDVMATTLAGSWLRALIFTAASLDRSVGDNLLPAPTPHGCQARREVLDRLARRDLRPQR